jgi:CRP/FNR family transcriptional regulator, cyclic AMP receptor protein
MSERKLSEVTEVIARVPLFSGLTKRQQSSVARLCFEARYEPGDTILREGERDAQHMIVLIDGTANVTQKGKALASVGAGEVIGEMALLDGRPRSASVIADTAVTGIVLYGTAFHKLLEEIPAINARLLTALAQRLRDRDERTAALG